MRALSRPTRLFSILVLGVGCSLSVDEAPSAPGDEDGPVVVPFEDGSTYVMVRGTPISAPAKLARQWRRAATDACQGDYILLSDSPVQRKESGVIADRSHEGFVRCVLPEASATLAEATARGEKQAEKDRKKGKKGPPSLKQKGMQASDAPTKADEDGVVRMPTVKLGR